MSRTSRLWRGAGLLTWGGLLLLGASARADDASLARQLSAAGRASLAQGRTAEARQILLNALKLDPNDAEARAALAKLGEVRLVAFQDPAPRPDTPPQPTAVDPALPDSPATIADSQRLANVARQEFNYSVGQRLQEARSLTNAGRPGDALDVLRGALNSVRSADQVSEAERRRLENQVRVQIGSTESAQQRFELEQAELYRRQGADDARLRTLATYERNQERIGVLMTEFDNLMAQGIYLVFATGGLGDIDATTLPFAQARERAIAARAIDPNHPAPRAGIFMSQTVRFLAQSYAYEELKEYRFMLTMQDIDRSSVPFPDTRTIEYPKAVDFVALTEKRRARYGDSEQLLDRDSRTKAITTQLNERLTMSFPNETPLEDVLKYIKDNTRSEELDLPSGIPIYVDPVGLQEADKTVTSPVTLDLEGIPLKTSLRLILKQLGLTYTVKDGLMTITTGTSEDVPTEIRVYQVADLAIIPISLISGGGGGGMGGGGMGGGGMGGGGMGGGGMGGGGMGGGMGGGGGGMGGFGSVPPQDPATLTDPAGAYAEKKSS